MNIAHETNIYSYIHHIYIITIILSVHTFFSLILLPQDIFHQFDYLLLSPKFIVSLYFKDNLFMLMDM